MGTSRRLTAALGRQNDYDYDKEQGTGAAGTRRGVRRYKRTVSKLMRRAEQRESARIIADER